MQAKPDAEFAVYANVDISLGIAHITISTSISTRANGYSGRTEIEAYAGTTAAMSAFVEDERSEVGASLYALSAAMGNGDDAVAYLHLLQIPQFNRKPGRAAKMWNAFTATLRELGVRKIYTLYGPTDAEDARLLRIFMQMHGFVDTGISEGQFPVLACERF